MKRRSFTSEFKQEAASLVVDQGYSIAEAGKAMDVNVSVIRRWVDQLQLERGGSAPLKGKAITPEQQRIQELEVQLRRSEVRSQPVNSNSTLRRFRGERDKVMW